MGASGQSRLSKGGFLRPPNFGSTIQRFAEVERAGCFCEMAAFLFGHNTRTAPSQRLVLS